MYQLVISSTKHHYSNKTGYIIADLKTKLLLEYPTRHMHVWCLCLMCSTVANYQISLCMVPINHRMICIQATHVDTSPYPNSNQIKSAGCFSHVRKSFSTMYQLMISSTKHHATIAKNIAMVACNKHDPSCFFAIVYQPLQRMLNITNLQLLSLLNNGYIITQSPY